MNPVPDYASVPVEPQYHPGMHRLAILVAAATFPLIFMGGLVTSHGAGLSVPDWPNSYGYNMFTFPPSQWVGGVFYEHTHRLLGTLAGFGSILLVLWAWGTGCNPGTRRKLRWWLSMMLALAGIWLIIRLMAPVGTRLQANSTHIVVGLLSVALILGAAMLARHRDPRRWVRWLTVAVLCAVIVQGILGGLRVVWVNLDLAWIHGCFAQAFFCLTGLMVAVTSRWWQTQAGIQQLAAPGARRLFAILAWTAVVLIYLQLVAGAVMRHYQAGLAIPDLPLAYGKFLPPVTADELAAVNAYRDSVLNMTRVSMAQVWVHFLHRLGAVMVTAAVLLLVLHVFRRHAAQPRLRRPAVILLSLLILQLTLGVFVVLLKKPADIASLHVAVGALTLFTAFYLAVRGARLYAGPNPVGDRRSVAPASKPASVFAPASGALGT